MLQHRFNNEVLNKFLENRECLHAFLQSTDNDAIKDLQVFSADLFEHDEIANRSQKGEIINGFVITGQNKKIYVISPSNDYLHFWGHRNFFTWRLAKNHQNRNDGIERHVLNIHNQQSKNHTSQFDIIKGFYIHNIYTTHMTTELNDWINALFVPCE